MKQYLFILSWLPALLLLATGCKKESVVDPPADMGYAYYPITEGSWIAWQVDSIDYNEFTQTSDTFRFQIKEEVGEVFFDNAGRKTYRLQRYYRPDNQSEWLTAAAWALTPTPERIERVEENIRFVPLVFPVRIGHKWNGNAFNHLDAREYKFIDVDAPWSLGSLAFDSCATVIQIDEATLISKDFASEIFVRNIGMVYKKVVHLNLTIMGAITSGYDYSYTLIEYGN